MIGFNSVSFYDSRSAQRERKGTSYILPLLLSLTCYQFVLCFINTNIFVITNGAVAATEGLLLALVAWRVLPTCRMHEIAFALSLLVYFFVLCLVRGEVDLAGPRNISIIFLAFAFGRSQPDKAYANKVVWIISGVVLFWAGMEYFFTNAYLRVFDILHYYIARGEVLESDMGWLQQNTLFNGVRFSGRNILPFLGDLRVSSVFLEPVSMGNYAIIVLMWALSFDAKEWRDHAFRHFILALILMVACDSRFASLLAFYLLMLRFVPILQKRGSVFLLPFLTVAGLIGFTLMGMGDAAQDTVAGRLMRSGQAVLNLNFSQILGIGTLDFLGDMGVAYSLEYFGIVLCLFLWFVFAFVRIRDTRASRYRLMLALYGLGILLVSGTSFFSAKTATIAWFLYGVLCGEQKKLGRDENMPPHFCPRKAAP